MTITPIIQRIIRGWTKPILICCLSIILLGFLNVGNYAYVKKIDQNTYQNGYKQNYLNGNEIKTNVTQELWFHGDGGDYNVNDVRRKNVSFAQTFKQIYVSNVEKYYEGKNLVDFVQQDSKYDENCCSGSHFNHNHNYELDQRIQNWSKWYQNNLYIGNIQNYEKSWGRYQTELFLKNSNLWSKKTEHREIKKNVVYGLENNEPKIFNTGRYIDFGCGFKKEFWNDGFNIYGIDTSFLKESGHTAVVYNWVNRYLWTLRGENTTDAYSKVDIVGNKPMINLFSLDDVVELTNASWENKTVQIKLNSKLTMEQKNIIEEIGRESSLKCSYNLYDAHISGGKKKIELTTNFQKLTDGLIIEFQPNEENLFSISDLQISLNEVINQKIYIQGSKTKCFTLNDNNIKNVDGEIVLGEPEYVLCNFINTQKNYKDIMVDEVDNKFLISTHVELIDSYGKKFSGNNLDSKCYSIERNSAEILIKIKINKFGEQELLLSGFKKHSNEPDEIEITKFIEHEIPSDVDPNRITEFLDLCGYDKIISHELIYSSNSVDDVNGILEVNGKHRNQNSGRNFKFSGFKKYFCLQKEIKKRIIPSKVTKDDFIKEYVDMSSEFYERNKDSLTIELLPNDSTGLLIANILTSNEYFQFSYKLTGGENKQFYGWFIVSGTVLFIGVILLVWHQVKRKKL